MTLDITESIITARCANCLEHTVLDPNTVADACSHGCHSTQPRGYKFCTMHAQYGCSNVCGRKERDRKDGGTEGGQCGPRIQGGLFSFSFALPSSCLQEKGSILTESKLVKTTHACHFHLYATERDESPERSSNLIRAHSMWKWEERAENSALQFPEMS